MGSGSSIGGTESNIGDQGAIYGTREQYRGNSEQY